MRTSTTSPLTHLGKYFPIWKMSLQLNFYKSFIPPRVFQENKFSQVGKYFPIQDINHIFSYFFPKQVKKSQLGKIFTNRKIKFYLGKLICNISFLNQENSGLSGNIFPKQEFFSQVGKYFLLCIREGAYSLYWAIRGC